MEDPTLPAQPSLSRASAVPSWGCTWGLALGLTAGWLAAGSCGVFVASLQALLVWLLLIAVALLVRPQLQLRGLAATAAALALLLLTPRVTGWSPVHLPLVVVATLGLMSAGHRGANRRLLLLGGLAVLTLTLFRFAQLQIPLAWFASEWLGKQLGHAAGILTGQPLTIGATFAGLDLLVAMTVLWIGLLASTRAPRGAVALFAAACILLAHTVYLTALAFTPQILDRLPPPVTALYDNPYVPPDFCWSTIARQLLPWNLPACGALLQTAVAVLIIRWTPWRAHAEAPPAGPNGRPLPRRTAVAGTCLALAILLPLIGALNVGSSRLDGTTILANQQDDFDYLVAQHDTYGQQSAGMFGLLPSFVQSLGGEFRTVRRLTPDRLRGAHLLLLLHPNESFVEHQQQIWDYVRDGGSVLIVTDGFHPEMGLEPAIAALLQPTAITVSQDAATSETGDWEAAYWVSAHGATVTASRSTTRFLTDHGASLQLGWGARPLVVGQWGWSAPQQGATWNASQPLRTGEKLGDLVMVAEQQIGKGRVVVLGSNAPLTNEGLVRSYAFSGNLLAYLTHDRTDTQASWRQVASILCCLGMIVLLWRNPQPAQLVCIGIILSVGFAATYAYSRYAARVLPDERLIQPSSADDPAMRIAYIDQSHLEAYSFEDWGFDAINGLALNLIRNGYLPLLLSEDTSARLSDEAGLRAGMFISVAPSKAFTAAERAALKSFVERGGIFLCTVGAEDAAPSAELLADFGLHVPSSPVPTGGGWPEPEPFGSTRALYLNVEVAENDAYQVAVRMHAAWPVASIDGQAEVIAYGHNQLRVVESDTELPVVIERRYGDGSVVLIGDTGFAMNKNLEYVGGEPFDGRYENANFWRWLITRLTDQSPWIPPREEASRAAATAKESE